jgi:excisionase family DNA binding protein
VSDGPVNLLAINQEDLQAVVAELIAKSMSPWLTIDGAARHASLSPKSIRRLISSGKLKAHRLTRGKILVSRIELDSLIRNSTMLPRKSRGSHVRQRRGTSPIGEQHPSVLTEGNTE